jgi:Putative DNA-binding domain
MMLTFIRSVLEFQSVVQLGSTPESLVLEFKAKIDGWNAPAGKVRKEAQKETCRDIAQFANTLGGCLLVGVNERLDPTRGVNVADAVVSIKKPEQLRQWIEQATVNHLMPSTFNHDITPISLPQGNIIATNVPASRHFVSLWDRTDHTIEYVRRTSHGKEWMNPDEMERHLMDGSRAGKLALIAAKEHIRSERVEVVGGVWREYSSSPERPVRWNPRNPITIGQMEEY